MATLEMLIDRIGVDVLEHLDRQADIPIIVGHQTQGDVSIRPVAPGDDSGDDYRPGALIPPEGVVAVRGEFGGHTHTLTNGLGCAPSLWAETDDDDEESVLLGVLTVPPGAHAYLAHFQHGYAGIGEGTYEIGGQREQADRIRRVAD